MTLHVPQPGDVLTNDSSDGCIVVSGPDVDVIDAIRSMVGEAYGGEDPARDNPAIIEAAKGVKVEAWRGPCSRDWVESEGVDDDGYTGWWAPHGDGPETIYVVAIIQSPYTLGELCEEAAEAAAESKLERHRGRQRELGRRGRHGLQVMIRIPVRRWTSGVTHLADMPDDFGRSVLTSFGAPFVSPHGPLVTLCSVEIGLPADVLVQMIDVGTRTSSPHACARCVRLAERDPKEIVGSPGRVELEKIS